MFTLFQMKFGLFEEKGYIIYCKLKSSLKFKSVYCDNITRMFKWFNLKLSCSNEFPTFGLPQSVRIINMYWNAQTVLLQIICESTS